MNICSIPMFQFPRKRLIFPTTSLDHSDQVYVFERVFRADKSATIHNFAVFMLVILCSVESIFLEIHPECLCTPWTDTIFHSLSLSLSFYLSIILPPLPTLLKLDGFK